MVKITPQPKSLEQVLRRIFLQRLFLPVLALIIFLIGLWAYLSLQNLEEQQLRLAASLAESVDGRVEDASRMLLLAVSLAEEDPSTDLDKHLWNVWESYGYFDTLYLLDHDGRVVLITPDDPAQIGLDMSRQPYYLSPARNGVIISSPFISQRTGQPTVYLTSRLGSCNSPCNWENGLAVAELNLEQLQEVIAAKTVESSSASFVIDRFGTPLAHSNQKWAAEQVNLGRLGIVQRGLAGPTSELYFSDGVFILGSAVLLEQVDWLLVIEQPMASVWQPYFVGSIFFLGLTLAVWFLLMWRIGVRLKRHVVIPLSRLGQGAAALASGDFSAGETLVQATGGYSEIQELAADFQRMSQSIQSRQADLQESERKLRGLFDQSYQFIGLLNPDGTLLDANDTALNFVAARREDVIGRPFWETPWWKHDPDEQSRLLEAVHRAAEGKLVRFETTHRDAQGELHNVDISIKPLRDDAGRVVMLIPEGRDITARKNVEEALHASQERLNAIIENMPGVAIQGYTADGRVVFWNKASEIIYGWSEREAVGKTLDDVSRGGVTAQAFLEQLREIERSGRPLGPAEFHYVNKNGRTGTATSVLFAVPSAPGEQLFISADVDITEQKRLESERDRRLAELETINRFSSTLRAADTLDAMLNCLVDEALKAINSEAGAIMLYEPASNELRYVVQRGWFTTLAEPPIKPGEGVAGTVFSSGATHVSTEFLSDPLTRPMALPRIPTGWGGACLPVRTAHETVGVLYVSVELPRQLLDQEIQLLSTLAEIAGNAIHRTRLYEKTEQQLQRIAALRAVDTAITSISDLRVILSVLLEQVVGQLGVHAAGIYLFNQSLRRLEFAAGVGFRRAQPLRSRIPLSEGYAGRAAMSRKLVHIPFLPETGDARAWLRTDEGFVAYFGAPLIAKGQVVGVLEVFHRAPLSITQDWLNFLESLAGQAAIAIDNGRLFDGLQRTNTELALAYDATIEGWSRALDLRDRETEGHTQRVTEMTLALSRLMGIGDADLVHIRRGALLHDIGKMGVPDQILHKPGPLSSEEWNIMQQHPQLGYDMLSSINFLRPALDIPFCHHEKWDSSGYPRGLQGEQIPLAARIFAVVDVWDALRSDRSYRPAWDTQKTTTYIQEQSGCHFDPRVAEVFLRMVEAG